MNFAKSCNSEKLSKTKEHYECDLARKAAEEESYSESGSKRERSEREKEKERGRGKGERESEHEKKKGRVLVEEKKTIRNFVY